MGVYDSAKTEAEIDAITSQRIRDLYGSVDEELKSLRKAIYAVSMLSMLGVGTMKQRNEAAQMGKELLKRNQEIEVIVSDGKIAKRNIKKEDL